MICYRTASVKTELVSRYPDNGKITTEQTVTVILLPAEAGLDVVTEKIDQGRRTRRFTIERVEVRYRRVVQNVDHDDLGDFEIIADATPWDDLGVSAYGISLLANGKRGVAKGYFHWSSQWGHDVPMPEALARAVAPLDTKFGIP